MLYRTQASHLFVLELISIYLIILKNFNLSSFFIRKCSSTVGFSLCRYIFFADNVEIQDITKQTCFFVLVGPKSNQVSGVADSYTSSERSPFFYIMLFINFTISMLVNYGTKTANGGLEPWWSCWTTIWQSSTF